MGPDQDGEELVLGVEDDHHDITVYPGGDPWTLSSRYFVPGEVAWAAVEEFCRTGTRFEPPEGIAWMTFESR